MKVIVDDGFRNAYVSLIGPKKDSGYYCVTLGYRIRDGRWTSVLFFEPKSIYKYNQRDIFVFGDE